MPAMYDHIPLIKLILYLSKTTIKTLIYLCTQVDNIYKVNNSLLNENILVCICQSYLGLYSFGKLLDFVEVWQEQKILYLVDKSEHKIIANQDIYILGTTKFVLDNI